MLVRAKREKTAKRGNSRWNINGGHESKLKRTIVLFPRFGIPFLSRRCLLFFLPRRSVSLALPVSLLSRRDFRNYEAIYIQMPVSNGFSQVPLDISIVVSFRPFFPPLFTDFAIFFSSTRLVSLTKASVIKQV